MALGHFGSVLAFALLLAACRASTYADAPAEHPSPAQKLPDARAPDVERPTVDVDLSPSGIGATIRGPDGAKAAAFEDYVVVDAEPDFHMQVHRGPIDLLAEKADIVKRWGPAFRRFVEDDDKAIVYETEVAADERFHFISWGEKDGLLYHCRSSKHGAESMESVKRMLDGCHTITVRETVVQPPGKG